MLHAVVLIGLSYIQVDAWNSTETTTRTPWDAFGGSGGDSLAGYGSSSASLNDDSSVSGSSLEGGSSGILGSTASGSSGSYIQLWQWFIVGLIALCCCAAIGAFLGSIGQRTKSKRRRKDVAPAPVPAESSSDGEEGAPLVDQNDSALTVDQYDPLEPLMFNIAPLQIPEPSPDPYGLFQPQYTPTGPYGMSVVQPASLVLQQPAYHEPVYYA